MRWCRGVREELYEKVPQLERDPLSPRSSRPAGIRPLFLSLLIFFFLLREGIPALAEVKLGDLFSTRWYPIENYFGILPLITGSIIVTLGAMLVAIPFGIGTAVFLSEIAPRWLREILKPLVELLGGLPSVVLGFLGILILSPFLRVFLEPADRPDRPGRGNPPGWDRRPHHCFDCRRCPGCRPAELPGRGAGAGRDQMADHLACDPAGCQIRRSDGAHARYRADDRRDHGGHDGDRQCPGDGRKIILHYFACPYHDGHHRGRNGRSRQRQHLLPCPVLHWPGAVPDFAGGQYYCFVSGLQIEDPRSRGCCHETSPCL